MSNSFACKNQDFDGPFEILMGPLEKKMSTRNLHIHLTSQALEGKPSNRFGRKFLQIKQSLNFSSVSRNRNISSHKLAKASICDCQDFHPDLFIVTHLCNTACLD